jgi:cellulose biosynthesis protein BcsQ
VRTVLNQALAIANGKGGVGKTSLTANIAVMAANSGWDTLVIDLDPQGNLGADLGYRHLGRSDEGRALSKAVQFEEPLEPPIRGIRDHLDAVPGGRLTRELADVLATRGARVAAKAMDAALAPLTERYDLILFDCPPGDDVLGDLGLAMARALVIPIKFDTASMDGLELMARRFRSIKTRAINSELELLGIVLFDFNPNATALRRQVEEELHRDFPYGVRIFDTAVRHSQRAAYDMRRSGMTAVEYEQAASEEREKRFALLQTDRDLLKKFGPAKSQAARGLANDYAALANEILGAFTEPTIVITDTDDEPLLDVPGDDRVLESSW